MPNQKNDDRSTQKGNMGGNPDDKGSSQEQSGSRSDQESQSGQSSRTSNRESQESNTPNRGGQQGQQGQGQQGNVSNPGSSSMDQDDISKTKGDRGSQSGTGRSSDLDQDES